MNSTARERPSPMRMAACLAAWIFLIPAAPVIGQDPAEPGHAETEVRPATEAVPEDDVMYRVLSAEMLGAEDDLEGAAAEYLAAALESEDPHIAERATSVAMAAQAWQHAAMAADRWVVLDPDNPEARKTAARVLLIAGDYVGAEYQLSGFLDLSSSDPMAAWQAVAELFQSASHTEKAGKALERLVDEHEAGDNPYALFARSQMAVRQGDLQQATEFADAAVRHGPDVAQLHLWAGRLALNQGDEAGAAGHFRNAWQLDPDDRMNALIYAGILRKTGTPDAAAEVLAGLPDTPKNRFTRIAFAVESGDRESAQELYRGFAEADYPDATQAALEAARSAEILGLPAEAVDWYRKIGEGEDQLMARMRSAVLLAELGRVDEAREVLAQARTNAPARVRIETFVTEGQVLMDAGRPEAAYEMLDAALEQFPDETSLQYSRALVAVLLGRIKQAESDLRGIIEREPDNAAALNALGYTLADRNERLAEAEALISAAYEIAPGEASIIDSKGWIAYRMGRLREAESYLREAFELDRNAEIAAHLGEVLWMLDKPADAREVWREGVAIDPDNRVLKETLQRFGTEH